MRNSIVIGIVSVLAFSASAFADTRTVSLVATNGQAIQYSDAIPASGYLEKVEVVQTSGCTSTVTVATFSGTTAIDTFASLTTLVGNKVVRPRIIGTTTAGVDLAAAVQAGADAMTNNVGTVLVGSFEKPLIGGNLKVAVTPSGSSTTGTGTNTVAVTLYFVPAIR